jgi:hypothetical protein
MRVRNMSLIMLIALGLGACGPASPPDPSAQKASPNVKMENADTTPEPEPERAKSIQVNGKDDAGIVNLSVPGKAPKGVPAFLPNYPGGVYDRSYVANVEKSSEASPVSTGAMIFTTPDDAQDVLRYYKDLILQAGMKETSVTNQSGMAMATYGKDQDPATIVTIIVAPVALAKGSKVTVSYSVPQ